VKAHTALALDIRMPFDLTMLRSAGDDYKMTELLQDVRQYGKIPCRVVVLHGGPGGAGEVEPFARELGYMGYDVLEPFQTRQSVGGQVDELRSQIEQYCEPPVVVVGWSWGAWLGCLLAAQHEDSVRALILVGSGPFEARYATAIRTTKKARLTNDELAELLALRPNAGNPADVARFIELSDVADTFSRDTSPQPNVMFDEAIHKAVWPEVDGMRKRRRSSGCYFYRSMPFSGNPWRLRSTTLRRCEVALASETSHS